MPDASTCVLTLSKGMTLNADKRYLAFDYGEKRIGVAIGNSLSHTATPLVSVTNSSGTPDWQKIDELVATWEPMGLIVGDPLTEDGGTAEITRQARGFAKRLGKRYHIPVFLIDERYSSISASGIISNQRKSGLRRRTQRGDLDKVAAAILMERWFSENS